MEIKVLYSVGMNQTVDVEWVIITNNLICKPITVMISITGD